MTRDPRGLPREHHEDKPDNTGYTDASPGDTSNLRSEAFKQQPRAAATSVQQSRSHAAEQTGAHKRPANDKEPRQGRKQERTQRSHKHERHTERSQFHTRAQYQQAREQSSHASTRYRREETQGAVSKTPHRARAILPTPHREDDTPEPGVDNSTAERAKTRRTGPNTQATRRRQPYNRAAGGLQSHTHGGTTTAPQQPARKSARQRAGQAILNQLS